MKAFFIKNAVPTASPLSYAHAASTATTQRYVQSSGSSSASGVAGARIAVGGDEDEDECQGEEGACLRDSSAATPRAAIPKAAAFDSVSIARSDAQTIETDG